MFGGYSCNTLCALYPHLQLDAELGLKLVQGPAECRAGAALPRSACRPAVSPLSTASQFLSSMGPKPPQICIDPRALADMHLIINWVQCIPPPPPPRGWAERQGNSTRLGAPHDNRNLSRLIQVGALHLGHCIWGTAPGALHLGHCICEAAAMPCGRRIQRCGIAGVK